MDEDGSKRTVMIVLAFAALYLIWGSTYLAIKVAIETMPPFLMAMSRFVLAGLTLYLFARARGATKPSRRDWMHSLIVGGLLIAGGNGIVSYAELYIDSSMAALIIASNPLFMTLYGWWGGVQARPRTAAWLSLAGGFAGVAILVWANGAVTEGNSIIGYVLVVLCVNLWTLGSIYSKRNPLKMNPWLQSGMQMMCGGFICLLMGLVTGELASVEIAAVSARSWYAFVYLYLVGSLVGFTSYVYLLRHCLPSTVSSHAYVNPVVAIFLGWLILDETLTWGGWVGSGLIIISVFVLLRQNMKSTRRSV